MTSRYFEDMIEQMLEVNGGEEDEIISGMREIIESFDDDASYPQVFEALEAYLDEMISKEKSDEAFAEADEGVDEAFSDEEFRAFLRELGEMPESEAVSEEAEEFLNNACYEVQAFLEENNWKFTCDRIQPSVLFFELRLNAYNNCAMKIRICVEPDPWSCHIEAVLPVNADAIYEYMLCEELSRLNYMNRYGIFKYDERDGEITCEYTLMANNGINRKKLETVFHAIVQTTADAYPVIRKCCSGRFKRSEIAMILKKAEAIIDTFGDE